LSRNNAIRTRFNAIRTLNNAILTLIRTEIEAEALAEARRKHRALVEVDDALARERASRPKERDKASYSVATQVTRAPMGLLLGEDAAMWNVRPQAASTFFCFQTPVYTSFQPDLNVSP